jgi:hypothetical protein
VNSRTSFVFRQEIKWKGMTPLGPARCDPTILWRAASDAEGANYA